MKELKLNVAASLSRVSTAGTDPDIIEIRLVDIASNAKFLDLRISLEDFAKLLTGMNDVKSTAVVRGLENLGRKKIIQERSVSCPLSLGASKSEIAAWMFECCQEPGWEIDGYLGAQNSIVMRYGRITVNYKVFRYVDEINANDFTG